MHSSIDKKAFGLRLRSLIEAKGVTVVQAARDLAIRRPQLSRYLSGQVPDYEMLVGIATWGSCSLDWLLTGQGETEKDIHLERLTRIWQELSQPFRARIVSLAEAARDAEGPTMDGSQQKPRQRRANKPSVKT